MIIAANNNKLFRLTQQGSHEHDAGPINHILTLSSLRGSPLTSKIIWH